MERMGKMTVQLGQKGRKSLMAIAVLALFTLSLNVALAAGSASIGGYVWYDDDGDGVFDQSEGGLEGVTVYLYR
ncbi:MAG: hypothetical protein FJ014_20425, partial [Chloroflexi bacterium]|nr:hypothetical protein [Chloroflexota bacterium]